MKIIDQHVSEGLVKFRCACDTEFWTDPCDEENLVFNGDELVAKCPTCGRIDD